MSWSLCLDMAALSAIPLFSYSHCTACLHGLNPPEQRVSIDYSPAVLSALGILPDPRVFMHQCHSPGLVLLDCQSSLRPMFWSFTCLSCLPPCILTCCVTTAFSSAVASSTYWLAVLKLHLAEPCIPHLYFPCSHLITACILS